MTWQVIQADVMDGLASLPDASVQTVITSPPYWGLRDYGTAEWEGGDAACDHRSPTMREGRNEARATLGGGIMATNSYQLRYAHEQAVCGKCGAVRRDQQLGLEPTPEAYVERMVAVFREVRRVLRPDGTVWLNLGDSYGAGTRTTTNGQSVHDGEMRGKNPGRVAGVASKQLVGIPWRVAFALQADGWYLRSDCIWAKPNPMPESVTDRPTKAHEYVFLLTRSARYFYDADAVREPHEWGPNSHSNGTAGSPRGFTRAERQGVGQGPAGDGLPVEGDMLGEGVPRKSSPVVPSPARQPFAIKPGGVQYNPAGRNLRSVWSIATEPYPEAHFATFPKALVVPCVKAGSRPGDTVLDPFAGSGTVGVVALRHGRSFIGIELNPTYAEMARERIRNDAPLFNHQAEVMTA